jgi:hypothetical protein
MPLRSVLTAGLPANVKLALAALVTLAGATHLLAGGYADWSAGPDTIYVMALMFLFFSRERSEDERVQELKLRALFVAFVIGWATAGVLRFASYLQNPDVVPRTIGAYDVMFVVLVVANALYRVWHHQDGREMRDPSAA